MYDAWGRVVSHRLLGGTSSTDQTTFYQYDALGRRNVEGPTMTGIIFDPGEQASLYYSADWQVIHEVHETLDGGGSSSQLPGGNEESPGGGGGGPEGSGTTVHKTIDYVWSIAYIDAMVLRETMS